MIGLFSRQGVVVFDTANVVARALSVAGSIDKFPDLFVQMLVNYRKKFPGRRFIFAEEGTGAAERRKIYDGYKKSRLYPTKEFAWARSKARHIIACCSCDLIMAPKGEADDAIAIFVDRHPQYDIIIISNDRDLWQHIKDDVKVYAIIKGKQRLVDKYACNRLFGVQPEHVVLFKSFTGDSSDEIPRAVSRLPKKVILRLVKEAGAIDNVETAVQGSTWLTTKQQEKILAAMGDLQRNVALVSARTHLNLMEKAYEADTNKLLEIVSVSNTDARLLCGVNDEV